MVNAKRILALVMAGVFLFQLSLTAKAVSLDNPPLRVTTAGEQETTAVEGISVEARFSSNHIRFDTVTDATGYNIWRCAEQNGEYEKINSEVIAVSDGTTKYSYIDKEAGTGTRLWYKVEVVKASENTFVGPAQDQYETGIAAVHQHAEEGQLHRDYVSTDAMSFNGERMETGTSQELERIKDLSEGTVLVTYRPENVSGRKALLVLKKKEVDIPTSGNMAGGIGFYQDTNKTRVDFSSDMRAAWNNTGAANTWNTFAFVSGAYTGTDDNIITSWNGSEQIGWNNESLGGLFSTQTDLESIMIGAVQNSSGKALGYSGKIAYITVTDEVFTQSELDAYTQAVTMKMRELTGISLTEIMLSTAYDDTTWVFVGGEAVSGGYDQVGNIRNYVGQYEEYIRWGRILSTPINNRQRYAINVGKEGRTLADIVANYDELVTAFRPRVVSYLVGKEDYAAGEAGLEAFKTNLKTFIDRTLTQKDYEENADQQFAFAVIQKPFAARDEATNATIQKYCEAVDEVKAEYTGGQASRVVVVDHFSQTNNDTFKNNKLIENGVPNVDGHYEIGKQLAAAAFGDASGYWNGSIYSAGVVRQMEEQPDTYLTEVQPQVTATADSLQVVIPEGNGTEWAYRLELEETTIEGAASSNSFTIPNLSAGKDYVLKIRSADGNTQLCTVKGRMEAGNTAEKNAQVLNNNQQRLAEMMESKNKMTWLFMGDSITHGARFTNGYDSVPQLFEKFVRDGLGRKDDIIVNSAVANGNTISTMENIVQRLENYTPDVVSIMLGTNDAYPNVATLEQYEQNMKEIVNRIKARNENAIIIFRTPTYSWDTNRLGTVPVYTAKLKEIADADPNIIYIDQLSWGEKYVATYSWLRTTNGQFLYADSVHPDGYGHLIMYYQFVKALGLWTEDSPLTNLSFVMPITAENNATTPTLDTKTEGTISLSVDTLKTDSGVSDLGAVMLKATIKDTNQSFEVKADHDTATVALAGLPIGVTYTVEVAGYQKNTAKKLTFASQEVTLEAEEIPVNLSELQTLVAEAEQKAETDYTEESWDTFIQALEQAREVIANNTNTDQTVVDAAKNSLQAAMDGLQEKEEGPVEEQMVETPVFSVTAGIYDKTQSVTITTATQGATIYYTIDGTNPTADSMEYTQAIMVSESMTIKAIAVKEGMKNSAVAEAAYVIQTASAQKETVKTPVFSIAAGTYDKTQSVTITSATEGAAIYYTTDGTIPTASSTPYTVAITIAQSMTIRAIAVKEGMENSAVAEAAYVIQTASAQKETVKTPVFSVAAGTYDKTQSVTITSATEGAAIYYTTDGKTPTTSSTKYSKAIMVDKTMTIKAIAVKSGMSTSVVATAVYTIKEEVKDKEWIFVDVAVISSNWKYESVMYVYNNDIMGAITGTREFQPDRPLSRSMFATVLYRMAGQPRVEYKAQFSDVPAGKWYSDAIIWAYQNKIVSGMGDGSFGIDLNITREQIAKMLYEYANVCKYDVSATRDLSSFTDVKEVSSWAVKYMQWATAVEMITGKPNDEAKTSYRMDPKGEATRAECAAMLMRFENRYK